MAKFSLSDLYVVVFPHTDGYSFDTGEPDEVYTTKEEADTFAAALNEHLATSTGILAGGGKKHFVETLYDRIQTIKQNTFEEGKNSERVLF